MGESELAQVTASTAREVAAKAELDDPATKLLNDQQTPHEFLDLLIQKQLWPDACRFLGQALPRREAVWWAYQCVLQAGNPPPDSPAGTALQLAEKWVLGPTEENRQPAMDTAKAAGVGSPAGATALAVSFSGGSMTAPDQIAVPPPDHVTGSIVATVVIMLATQGDPAKVSEAYQGLLALGIDVAKGTSRWKEPAPPPPAQTPLKLAPARPQRR
jgi:hypothetical protein